MLFKYLKGDNILLKSQNFFFNDFNPYGRKSLKKKNF